MNRFLIAGVILIAMTVCKPETETRNSLKTGIWRAAIQIQGQELPFNFEVTNDKENGYDIYIRNANEKLLLDEVSVLDDSVNIALHIFDANIKAVMNGDSLKGEFIKNYEKDYRIPFKAVYGQAYRFEKEKSQAGIPDFNGMYEVMFLGDTTQAVGIFSQQGDSVTGTFLTPTGDYRFLQGNISNGKCNSAHSMVITHIYLRPQNKLIARWQGNTIAAKPGMKNGWQKRMILPHCPILNHSLI
jgi:hypothetical protein